MDKIKIGEIKRQSLMLLFPELELSAYENDSDSLNSLMDGLLCDPSIKSYLDSMAPAINRALGKIELAGAQKTEIKELNTAELTPLAGGYYLDLDKIGAKTIKEIFKGRSKIPFSYSDKSGALIYGEGDLKILYKPKIKRISQASDHGTEINLPREVAEIIPYFVKSELLLPENESESRLSLNEFEKSLATFSDCLGAFEINSVYSLSEV